MQWRQRYLEDLGVVEAVYTGPQPETTEELQAAVEASLAVAAEHGARLFLADCSGLTGDATILPAYEVAAMYASMPVSRQIREAVVLPRDPDAVRGIRFYETAVRNRGYVVQTFANREDALEWLTGNS